ncbi:alpha/beta fold hydrolase [Nocardia yamanashiensis]|uniref:alpha/beta fold hydrolase n=1 Tax=Nocardia yamanashiensis TaxID=209247 RepID=UPI000831D146|nr:alpha/beta hydrolase [Nocardia yamanashiensis]
MPFVTRGGVQVSYSDSGGGERAIVLGHCLFMDQEMFAAQVAELAPEYRVITIDSRGHGASRDDGGPFSYWDLARDAWAVVDELGLEKVVVGGVSHGAFTALRMALLARPRVEGVITLSATAVAMDAQRRVGYTEVIDAWTIGTPFAATARMVASLMIGGTAQDQQPWRDKWLTGDRERTRMAAECSINRDSVVELLGEITCPALVIRGDSDHSARPFETDQLAAAFGGPVQTHTIIGAAMTPNLTHPEQVNALLRKFLADLPG